MKPKPSSTSSVSLGLKNIAVFYQNDGFGKSGLDGVTAALKNITLPHGILVERNSVEVASAVMPSPGPSPRHVVMVTLYKPTAASSSDESRRPEADVHDLSPVGTEQLVKDSAPMRAVGISQVMPPYPWNDIVPMVRDLSEADRLTDKLFVLRDPRHMSWRVTVDSVAQGRQGIQPREIHGGSRAPTPISAAFASRFSASNRRVAIRRNDRRRARRQKSSNSRSRRSTFGNGLFHGPFHSGAPPDRSLRAVVEHDPARLQSGRGCDRPRQNRAFLAAARSAIKASMAASSRPPALPVGCADDQRSRSSRPRTPASAFSRPESPLLR